nr:lipopolysaccharide biosynthesis protein [Variovorax boronicumulans]
MLGRRVALGAALLTALQLLMKFVDVISLVIMARLLTPADFGLVALAASVVAIVRATTELNVSEALVQRKEIDPRDVDTAFTLNFIRAVLVALATVGAALPLAAIYDDSRLVAIMLVLAIPPVLAGLSSPAMVYYLHRLEYGPGARVQLVGRMASFVVAIAFAYATRSYWALIASQLVAPLVSTVYTYILAPYRPRFRVAGTKSLLNFAGWTSASRFISTINLQSDRFLIGHILGKPQLGQYTVGSDMASMVTYAFAGPIMQTMFGGFARLAGEPERMRAAYLKAQQMLVIVLLPFGFGLAATADHVVPLVLGPNWDSVVTVIYWLAPVVSLQVLYLPMLSLSMAMGQPKVLVVREAVNFGMRVPLTLGGAWYFGLLGAVIARSLGGLVIIGMTLMIARRFVQITVLRQISNIWRSLISVAVMVAGVELLKHSLSPPTGAATQILHVGLLIGTGAALYGCTHLALWLLAKRPDGAEQFILHMAGWRKKA